MLNPKLVLMIGLFFYRTDQVVANEKQDHNAGSWQEYVDKQICANVPCKLAVIAGLQDGAIWAKFEKDLTISQQELKTIADTMRNNVKSFNENGIHLGGEKYLCIGAENNLIQGRFKDSSLVIVATNKCLVAAATDKVSLSNLNSVLIALGNYLRENSY